MPPYEPTPRDDNSKAVCSHQLAQASSPAVPKTASRRALSGAFAWRWSVHADTAWNALRTASAVGHGYAGTRESI
jgi:hypothetical protein